MAVSAQFTRLISVLLVAVSLLFAVNARAAPESTHPVEIPLPGGGHGLDLDDMGYVPALHRIVVPAGQTGALVLIDSDTNALELIPGIAPTTAAKAHGRDEGTSSAAYGEGFLFASDHTDKAIAIVNPAHRTVLSRAPLKSGSDYVRYLASAHEVWVTEPRAAQIQVFHFSTHPKPVLTPEAVIPVPGGPESLVFDAAHHRAYTNLWKEKTVAMNTVTHTVVAHWSNGCKDARGLALDHAHHHLFVACKEGAVSVLSLPANGKLLVHVKADAGIDIISYSPRLHQLYIPGSRSATLTIFHVAASGALKPLATYPTAKYAHCVADDNYGHIFVCNPHGGGVLEITEHAP
ncbi:MAG: hypothetical protein WCB49_09675 [Gammaproteobacteria bacterium]